MSIAKQQWEEVALRENEYELIVSLLGREPTLVELGMFGAMWSEHCGYKHSRPHLRQLPTDAPWVLQGPGENAGAVDIGHGLAAVFKVESHNHPSAVEPYEGAATGVGGIVRDVFTMGARPIAILDALRFGSLEKPRNQYLFSHVVAGIGGYGNCLGIPTVGGDAAFDPSYDGNPIVNAMCVGIVPHGGIVRARASGVGNRIVLIGARTGRDGLHGATFASVDDPEATHRGVIQVGNPFLEKQLMEACLELLKGDSVVAMQDLGAAGLTSSIIECASRGGVGVDIDVADVPRRDDGMSAYEVMLSESQERMVLVCAPERVPELVELLRRWSLSAQDIGEVTDDGLVTVRDRDDIVCSVPVELFIDACPTYHITATEPDDLKARRQANVDIALDEPTPIADDLLALLADPNIGSRRPIWEQYDHTILTNTVMGPGDADAAVLRIKGTEGGIAISIDCNSRYCELDPYNGARLAVAEAARNVACVGARPLGITNCLNMGNPERAPGSWHLQESVRGIADACRNLELPVVSGNVSLYNESGGRPIQPTPMIGCVGALDDVSSAKGLRWQDGDRLLLLRTGTPTLGASAWQRAFIGSSEGSPPEIDLALEHRLQEFIQVCAKYHGVHAIHDVALGGIAVTIGECSQVSGSGAAITVPDSLAHLPRQRLWFGEVASAVIFALSRASADLIIPALEGSGIWCDAIGTVGGDAIRFPDGSELSIVQVRTASEGALVAPMQAVDRVRN